MMTFRPDARGRSRVSAGAEENVVAAASHPFQTVLRKVASMRILVVCGAGASSTFVAQRLRRAAAAAGFDWETSAGTEDSIASGSPDLILIGPHLVDRVAAIRGVAQGPVAVLPADVFGDRDGVQTLAFVRAALSAAPTTPKGTP
jgi:PTS system cellobiose-specific IIB component